MHEAEIRKALWRFEFKAICQADPLSLVIDELGILEGKHRIDIAVVNGDLSGYEIKSDSDTLQRLPDQQEAYAQVFDKLTLVADERHVAAACAIVPSWWGLLAVSLRQDQAHVEEIWRARTNQKVDPFCLAQLLWKEEALAILKAYGLGSGMSNRPRKVLWQVLAKSIELGELKKIVRNVLRNRARWR